MNVIVATAVNADNNKSAVLATYVIPTIAEESHIMYSEIRRLLNEFNNPDGINLKLVKDTFDEEVLVATYDENSIIEYKIMDGEHGR